jgi:hypothetical protein
MRTSWTADDARAFYRHAFYDTHGWVECITATRYREAVVAALPRRVAHRASGPPAAEPAAEDPGEQPHRVSKRWHRVVFWAFTLVVAYCGVRVILT